MLTSLLVLAAAASATLAQSLPSTFQWNSTGPLIYPKNDSRAIDGIKDPSIIYYDGAYHVFCSTANDAGYGLVYLTFNDFNEAEAADFYYLDQSGIGTGYRAAPEVFFFEPHNLWYLVYQNGNAAWSTNTNISDPSGWTAPTNFYDGTPDIITANIGTGSWVDMWVICDSADCFLFSSDDNGHLYRSTTSISDFPSGMSQPVIAMSDTNIYGLFEASNVYKVGSDEYLLLVEAFGADGYRFFRSWNSSTIDGTWTPLADTEENPWASHYNIHFDTPSDNFTQSVSHGEAIRTVTDQTLTLSPCNLRYLYQGIATNDTGDYNAGHWKLALLTQTNTSPGCGKTSCKRR